MMYQFTRMLIIVLNCWERIIKIIPEEKTPGKDIATHFQRTHPTRESEREKNQFYVHLTIDSPRLDPQTNSVLNHGFSILYFYSDQYNDQVIF